MRTTRVFKSGNSQAVRIPRDFRLAMGQIEILRRGEEVVLRPRRKTARAVYRALTAIRFPEDFPDTIEDTSAEGRGPL